RVVLVAAAGGCPGRREDADHLQRHAVNIDGLPERVTGPEELFRRGRPEDGDGGHAVLVGCGQEPALGYRAGAGFEPARGGAHHVGGPVRGAGDQGLRGLRGGATTAMSGAATLEASASASCTLRVVAEPRGPFTPPALVALPGVMISRLVPSELIWARICAEAPSPSPTVRITAAIPIRMPSIVSPDRSRCARMASSPVRRVSRQFTGSPPRRRCRQKSGRRAGAPCASTGGRRRPRG